MELPLILDPPAEEEVDGDPSQRAEEEIEVQDANQRVERKKQDRPKRPVKYQDHVSR